MRGAFSLSLLRFTIIQALASPNTLNGILLYRDICNSKVPWDARLPEPLLKRWKEYSNISTEELTALSTPAPHHQPISEITLPASGDASTNGVSAAVYAVAQQNLGSRQGLVCAKFCIAKRNLTIPRLELIPGHMTVNLVTNI